MIDGLFILGILIFGGYLLALVLKQARIPNVISFLLAGFLLGNFLLRDEVAEAEEWFVYVELLTLGLIGFAIGTELKISEFRKRFGKISALLLGEVVGAFVMIYLVTLVLFRNPLMSLILAGIGTATAPAATVEIIRKTRSDGEVTNTLQWLLAIDDFVAIFVVEVILSYLIVLTEGVVTLSGYLLSFWHEIGLAVVLGLVAGFALDFVIENMFDDELEMMELTAAVLVFIIGLAGFVHTSAITVTMVMGLVATNSGGDNYANVKDLLEVVMAPVIALFFVLVGARISIVSLMAFPVLALVYLLSRTFGKIGGSYLGAKSYGLDEPLRSNTGLGLLAQGGVALGLIAEVQEILSESQQLSAVGNLVFGGVIISTLLSEMLGAAGTQVALHRAGEIGKAGAPLSKRITYMHE